MATHVNIPIFIPEKACPHRCIFCNQANISGQKIAPLPSEVKAIIDTYLKTIPSDRKKQVAFFGGSFTGIAIDEQKEYLEVVAPYIENKQIEGIRVSTRPDYIDKAKLELLRSYHVKAIELGAQSFNQEVLQLSSRGHTMQDTINAAGLINEFGFELGLQMMLGLPGDTAESATFTAQEIIRLKAQTTRIYPALVIAQTPLEILYHKGEYTPLSLEEAIKQAKKAVKLFEAHNIKILKVGLHPSEELCRENKIIAGPFHPSFRELVLSDLWLDRIIKNVPPSDKKITIRVPFSAINYAIGYNSCNMDILKKTIGNVKIKPDTSLTKNEITYSYH